MWGAESPKTKGTEMKLAIPTVAVAASAALLVACAPEMRASTAAQDYATHCASCHGASGRGDGPAAAGLTPRPADLTTISARHGGTFLRLQVLGWISGYTMGRSESHMPVYGRLLDGERIMYDAGDGNPAPTPARIVGLVEYLERLQK